MKETLIDIRSKITSGAYKNEEHVRLQIVVRILSKLGWEIWDPAEVNCEFNPVPYEDKTKVDIALFSKSRKPSVFIEVKALGKIVNLPETEMQLRNYNRDNAAPFSIITDGQIWRFYLSQAAGKFSERCFKIINLLDDDLDEIQNFLSKFLNKQEISNGNSEQEAKKFLRLTEKQRAMEENLPRARKNTMEHPYPRLPDALMTLVIESGHPTTIEEAETFIEESKGKETKEIDTTTHKPHLDSYKEQAGSISEEMIVKPDSPPNLAHTKIDEAIFEGRVANNWNNLLIGAIKTAIQKGMSIEDVRELSIPVQRGRINKDGYVPRAGTDFSFQDVDANRAWSLTLALAKRLNAEVTVRFTWRDKEKAAYPGKKAILMWKP